MWRCRVEYAATGRICVQRVCLQQRSADRRAVDGNIQCGWTRSCQCGGVFCRGADAM